MHEESTNGGRSRQLDDGEGGNSLPHVREKKMGQRRRKLRPPTSVKGGRREVRGSDGTRRGKMVPYLGRLRALRGRFKLT
jgi:hypothetical protein